MFKILIADDERFERDGVKFLIDKYSLDLEVIEAESGEAALDYLKNHPVDILFTDIRMGEMDGLQLATHVRELQLPAKIIFFSAYGEFEYAQKAIDLKAVQYILKPVEVHDFLRVLSGVIQMCKDEQKDLEQQIHLKEVYRKGIQWEKHRILSDLLNSASELLTVNDFRHTFEQLNGILSTQYIEGEHCYRIMMLDTRKRFFDSLDADFERNLSDLVNGNCSIINLNEYQNLVLIAVQTEDSIEYFTQLGKNLLQWFKESFNIEIYIVFSDLFYDTEKMRSEYQRIETILESRFFFEEGTILFTNAPSQDYDTSEYLDRIIADISSHLEQKEIGIVHDRFEQLFDNLKNNNRFSALYVKYISSEIVRFIFNKMQKKDLAFFQNSLETIYKTTLLKDLRQVMTGIFEEYASLIEPASHTASMTKVIEDVIQIIEREYQTDLSVEFIAERVYLTPSYLSHLFSKQTGVSIIKYLTIHRLEKANQLLKETNRKIIEISSDVGYSNFPYFCTLFKNYYGKTPTQVREGRRI